MPTGYTDDLYKGKPVTFPEFAMKCARAFGVLVTMRDDPLDAAIPTEFAPDTYHVDEVVKAKARLAEVYAWTPEEAADHAYRAYDAAFKKYTAVLAETTAIRARYEAMLAQVGAWQVPTSDHAGLKSFMIQQLTTSIEHDGQPWYERPTEQSGEAYRAGEITAAQWKITYHTREYEKEVERAQERTTWIQALRASLGGA